MAEISSKDLGQIVLIQSAVAALPDIKSMLRFICQGLRDISAITKISYHIEGNQLIEKSSQATAQADVILPVKRNNKKYATLILSVADKSVFQPYLPFIENLTNMLGVIIEEQQQRQLNQTLIENMEQAINDRTKELEVEIAERKLAQKALQESEERFKLAVQGTKDGLWDWNLLNNNAYYSDQYAKMLGYKPGELPYTSEAWSELLHPDDKEAALIAVNDYLNQKIGFYESVFRMRTKDGNYRWIRGRGKSLCNEKGEPVRFVGFNTDITEQKLYEYEIEQKNKELQLINERINNINTELEKSKLKAEESDRLKTTFLANLSHEIRTPMNGILGFANLLKKDNLSEKNQKKYLEIIERSGQRMLNLINDLVDISKIDSGQVQILNETTNLNELMDKLFVFYERETNQKKLNFSYSMGLPNRESLIITDIVKLEQILSNLLNNSLKFTQEGFIEFGYKPGQNKLTFWVANSGPGIPGEYHQTIFERFGQVESSPLRGEEGSGLGLAISKGFIESMGGEIWLESENETGVTFYFTIPFTKAEALKDENKEGDAPGITKKATILVAEDDEISFLYLEQLLSSNGISILHAKNGKEAINMANENSGISLILMDIKMPEMNGLEAIKKIRETNATLPIIAQSAYAATGDIRLAMQTGCNDYLTKPIDPEVLHEILEKYLG